MPRQRVHHEPENAVLYQVVREHLPGFLQSSEDDGSRSPLPRFVVRELRAFRVCGLLCFFFCRVHCSIALARAPPDHGDDGMTKG